VLLPDSGNDNDGNGSVCMNDIIFCGRIWMNTVD
jgi:hypothetical protein